MFYVLEYEDVYKLKKYSVVWNLKFTNVNDLNKCFKD